MLRTKRDKSKGAPQIIGVKRGESGYYPIFTGISADELNAMHGVSAAQREAMYWGSLFGWDTPGAFPDSKVILKLARVTTTEKSA